MLRRPLAMVLSWGGTDPAPSSGLAEVADVVGSRRATADSAVVSG